MKTILANNTEPLTLRTVAGDSAIRGGVAVYAASSSDIDDVYKNAAHDLGHLLAGESLALVDGGGAMGLMGAVNDECLRAGGCAIGVIPHFMYERGWGHKSLTAQIIANDMHHRKELMAQLAENAVIALPGGVGTFEEILEIITWRKLGLYSRPAILLNANGFYDPLIQMLQKAEDEGFITDARTLYDIAQTPRQALEIVNGSIKNNI